MDGEPCEANCLCGKFIGDCLRLHGALQPGGGTGSLASPSRYLEQRLLPFAGHCLLGWVDSGAPMLQEGQTQDMAEKLFFKQISTPHLHLMPCVHMS